MRCLSQQSRGMKVLKLEEDGVVRISESQQLEEFLFDPSGVLVSSQFAIDFGQPPLDSKP